MYLRPRTFAYLAISLCIAGSASALPSRYPAARRGILNPLSAPLDLTALGNVPGVSCYELGDEITPGRVRRVQLRHDSKRKGRVFFSLSELNRSWLRWYKARLKRRGLAKRTITKRLAVKRELREQLAETAASACATATFRSPAQCDQTLSTSSVAFTFVHDADYGVVLKQIEVPLADTSAVSFVPAKFPLWEIGMLGKGDAAPTELMHPSGSGIVRCIPDAHDQSLVVRWEGRSPASGGKMDIILRISPNVQTGAIEFKGGIEVDESVASVKGIGAFSYPQIVIANTDATSQILKGMLAGVAIQNPIVNAIEKDAEGHEAPLSSVHPRDQTLAMDALSLQDKAALIMSTNDIRVNELTLKDFYAGAVPEGVLLTVKRTPGGAFTLQDNPDTGVTVFAGKPIHNPGHRFYYDVAQWYRAAKLRTLSRPKLHSAAAPALQRNASLIALVGSDLDRGLQYADNVDYVQTMLSYLQTPASEAGVLWYDWHKNPFDRELPEHWPPKPGFTTSLFNQMKGIGLGSLGVYINPVFWSRSLPSFDALDIIHSGAVVASNGGAGLGGLGATIDPASPQGYSYSLDSVLRNVVDTFGANMAYNDVFPWAGRCYSETHEHPVGGGAETWESMLRYSRANASLIESKGSQAFLLSEGAPESLLEIPQQGAANEYRFINFKALPIHQALTVPLFDAVYREYIPIVSSLINDMPGEPILKLAKTAARTTRERSLLTLVFDYYLRNTFYSFVHGHLPVLVHRPIPDDVEGNTRLKDDTYASVLVSSLRDYLSLYRHSDLRAFLHGGRAGPFLGAINVATSPMVLTGQLYSENPDALPRVFSNTLLDDDSNILVMLANWTENPETISFVISPDTFGMRNNGASLEERWEVVAYLPNNGTVQEVLLTSDLNENLSLLAPSLPVAPRAMAAYLLRKAQ